MVRNVQIRKIIHIKYHWEKENENTLYSALFLSLSLFLPSQCQHITNGRMNDISQNALSVKNVSCCKITKETKKKKNNAATVQMVDTLKDQVKC